MSHPSSISGAFGLPFAEQIAFFRRKLGNLVPTERWDDMVGEAHDTGFMVAGAAEADLLTDLAAAVDKSIAEGRGIEEFRKDFRSIVARNGWTGWTGEGSVVGEAWRVKTILRTNAYTSYAAGRFAQLSEGNFPFWVYRHGDSVVPRPQHLEWDGLVLPPEHIFWIKFYPPSDWGCSCYVVGARSERAAKRLGGDLSKKLPANWNAIDPKTGEPVGIGKGWGYAPGASVVQAVQAAASKVRNWDYALAKAFMSSLPSEQADALSQSYRALPSTADDARRFATAARELREDKAAAAPVRTMGLVQAPNATQIDRMTKQSVAGFDYRLSGDGVRHVFKEHGDDAKEALRGQRGVVAADFSKLPQILSSPDAITGSNRSELNELLVHFVKTINGERYTASFAVNKSKRSLTLKTMFITVGKRRAPMPTS